MEQPSTPFDLHHTPEYREFGFQIVKFPICGKETLDNHWICNHCKWEYDGVTDDNEYSDCNGATPAEYFKKRI